MIAHQSDIGRKHEKREHMQRLVDRVDRLEGWPARRVVELRGELRVVDARTGEIAEKLPEDVKEQRQNAALAARNTERQQMARSNFRRR